MALLNKADEIMAVWNALSSSLHSDEGWMTLPVSDRSSCLLKAGRRFPSREEALLVGFRSLPSLAETQFPEGKGFVVKEVTLGKEGEGFTWLALLRLPAGSLEMFSMMATDIVLTLEGFSSKTEDRIFSLFLARIRAWQNFMQNGESGLLGFQSEIGLYGELLTLEAIIHNGMSSDLAVESWIGPCDGIQDFMIGNGAIEVKTTTSAGTFPAWISSLEQLDDSHLTPLYLAAHRICQIDNGSTLPDKIEEIRNSLTLSNPEVLPVFDLKLLQAGYINCLAGRYSRKYELVETRIYLVNEAVPRLIHATVPSGILRAKYEIDIESINSECLPLQQVLQSLGAI